MCSLLRLSSSGGSPGGAGRVVVPAAADSCLCILALDGEEYLCREAGPLSLRLSRIFFLFKKNIKNLAC